tara:strand:- start:36 stop:476 length:441 start_codon:yes stop_codon:yes gene_type:complete
MANLNRVEFIGRLGADPEVRRLQNGDAVANLRLAVSETWKGGDGERKERTEWIPITVYNPHLVKVIENYATKGSQVFVAGQWQSRKWTDQSGNERYTTECVLQKFRGEFQLLDSKPYTDSGQRSTSYDDQSGGYGAQDDDTDSIPF